MTTARRDLGTLTEGDQTEDVHIDISAIPDHVRDDLAEATLDFIRSILQQPGGRERIERKKATWTTNKRS